MFIITPKPNYSVMRDKHINYLVTLSSIFLRSCFSQVRYRADWSNDMAFRSILISPRMLTDHMPDIVLRALGTLTKDKPFSLCPSSLSDSQHNAI